MKRCKMLCTYSFILCFICVVIVFSCIRPTASFTSLLLVDIPMCSSSLRVLFFLFAISYPLLAFAVLYFFARQLAVRPCSSQRRASRHTSHPRLLLVALPSIYLSHFDFSCVFLQYV